MSDSITINIPSLTYDTDIWYKITRHLAVIQFVKLLQLSKNFRMLFMKKIFWSNVIGSQRNIRRFIKFFTNYNPKIYEYPLHHVENFCKISGKMLKPYFFESEFYSFQEFAKIFSGYKCINIINKNSLILDANMQTNSQILYVMDHRITLKYDNSFVEKNIHAIYTTGQIDLNVDMINLLINSKIEKIYAGLITFNNKIELMSFSKTHIKHLNFKVSKPFLEIFAYLPKTITHLCINSIIQREQIEIISTILTLEVASLIVSFKNWNNANIQLKCHLLTLQIAKNDMEKLHISLHEVEKLKLSQYELFEKMSDVSSLIISANNLKQCELSHIDIHICALSIPNCTHFSFVGSFVGLKVESKCLESVSVSSIKIYRFFSLFSKPVINLNIPNLPCLDLSNFRSDLCSTVFLRLKLWSKTKIIFPENMVDKEKGVQISYYD